MEIGLGEVVAYQCSHCGKNQLRIWVHRRNDVNEARDEAPAQILATELRKLGQYPPQTNDPPPEIRKGMSDGSFEMYRKGLTSLNHGFGLGALAYFRRVVEEGSDELLDLFIRYAEEVEDDDAVKRLKSAKEGGRMEQRLQLAADALPSSLRPGGVNPLSALYIHYSKGIHGLSEEDCLSVARELVFGLEYTFRYWKSQMEEAERFREHMQEWSDPNRT